MLHTCQAPGAGSAPSPRRANRPQRLPEGTVPSEIWGYSPPSVHLPKAPGSQLEGAEKRGGHALAQATLELPSLLQGVAGRALGPGPRRGGNAGPREGKSREFGRTPRPLLGGAGSEKLIGSKMRVIGNDHRPRYEAMPTESYLPVHTSQCTLKFGLLFRTDSLTGPPKAWVEFPLLNTATAPCGGLQRSRREKSTGGRANLCTESPNSVSQMHIETDMLLLSRRHEAWPWERRVSRAASGRQRRAPGGKPRELGRAPRPASGWARIRAVPRRHQNVCDIRKG